MKDNQRLAETSPQKLDISQDGDDKLHPIYNNFIPDPKDTKPTSKPPNAEKKSFGSLSKNLSKSKIKSKRKSRSKNRRQSTEERKTSKNTSNDSKKFFKQILKPKKSNLLRPFSGGLKKQSISQKSEKFKFSKAKPRPKTAKQSDKKLDPEIKSPGRKKLLSPGSSRQNKKQKRKHKAQLKSGNKKTNASSKNRKASLSPSTEMEEKYLFRPQNGKPSKETAIDPEIPINLLTNQYQKLEKERKLVMIQKFLRGYQEHNKFGRLLKEKRLATMKVSSSSSNTFERATNQVEVLKMMHIEPEIGQKDLQEKNEEVKESPQIIKKGKITRKPYSPVDNQVNTSYEKVPNKPMKEVIRKSLEILKKKRPRTANTKKLNTSHPKENSDNYKKLRERLNGMKFPKISKTKNPNSPRDPTQSLNTNSKSLGKPPLNHHQTTKLRDQTPISKDSLSEIFTQNSPSVSQDQGFEKYQMLIKKQIKADYLSDLSKIKQRVESRKRK